MIFPFFNKFRFLGILGPPYCGISATIRSGGEMLCLLYAGFFFFISVKASLQISVSIFDNALTKAFLDGTFNSFKSKYYKTPS